MKPPSTATHGDDPRDLAAAWYAYLQSDDASEAGRRACADWREADPEHERQYQNVERIWVATQRVPEEAWRAVLAKPLTETAPPRRARRQFALGLAGVGALALAGISAFGPDWRGGPQQTLAIATQRGERHQMTLPDGSVLDINTQTRARVQLFADRRVVELWEGEIFFTVASDAARPFLVDAGDTQVRVTGTRFNVRHEPALTQVSVTAGSVQVRNGAWWQRQSVALVGGQGVTLLPEQPLGPVETPDLAQRLAWQRGTLRFENTPLAQVLAEMNRYLPQPARLEAPALAGHRISAIVQLDDPRALLDMLPEFAPVRVFHLPDGQTRIVAR